MAYFDVFNGDADGLCALQQLRLAEPRAATLVTGVKRDIALLRRVPRVAGASVTVLGHMGVHFWVLGGAVGGFWGLFSHKNYKGNRCGFVYSRGPEGPPRRPDGPRSPRVVLTQRLKHP